MTGHAKMVGATLPFGAEIVARLEADGYRVEEGSQGSGRLDMLVVNAPVEPHPMRFGDISTEAFEETLEQQLYGPVEAVKAAAARMTGGGSIVLVSSRAHLGAWGGTHRAAAGAALVGMARSMSLEFAALSIRVNVLAPDFAGADWDTADARRELAAAVVFLGSAGSALISGETILLDRGRSLRMTESTRR